MPSNSLFPRPYSGDQDWNQYLLDFHLAVEKGNALQEQSLQVGREQSEELQRQSAEVIRVREALEGGLDEMRSEFQWGFGLMVDRMDRQIEQTEEIAAKLDEIHKTLKSPLMTEARELFKVGNQRFRNLLLDKALEAFLQSERKNEVDFLLQLQISRLYLYGQDDDDNVVNLPEAERHALLAARYAEAEKHSIGDWNVHYCGEAWFLAGKAACLIGMKEHRLGCSAVMGTIMERALVHLAKAILFRPRLLESHYIRAKCYSYLGNREGLCGEFKVLSDSDRNYYKRPKEDRDFSRFGEDIEEVFRNALIAPGPRACSIAAKLERADQALEWARRSRPDSKYLSELQTIDRDLGVWEQKLQGLEVDLVDLDRRVDDVIRTMWRITDQTFQFRMNAQLAENGRMESVKTSSENAIKNLLAQQQAVQGNWWITCGSGCLVYLFVFFILSLSMSGLYVNRALSQNLGQVIGLVAIVLGLAGCVLGYIFSRQHHAQAFRPQVEAAGRKIQECDGIIPLGRERAAELQREINAFAVWNKESASGSPPAGQIDAGPAPSNQF